MTKTNLVGKSLAHCRLISIIDRVAPTDAEVLISGPTGVGKELYAHYLHECSPRREARFVAINCGALPSDLFENELFGHIGGAFTGAHTNSEGLIMEAENGTLFLDEVDSSLTLLSSQALAVYTGKRISPPWRDQASTGGHSCSRRHQH